MSARKPGSLFPDRRFQVVVVGASAGGVEALTRILPGVAPASAYAVSCVLHLRAATPSLLPDVMRRFCRVPVKEVESAEPMRPAMIYFAPPDYHLSIERDLTFSLSCENPIAYSRPSIDVLFESAAGLGPRVLGILLTGSNADGAMGLRSIRMSGGGTIVQSPNDALFAEMPNAALRLFTPDAVLPVDGIRALLEEMNEQPDPGPEEVELG